MDHLRTRALRLLLGTFVLYGVLVATHKGEFWPFSIFPMFSQAGGEWSRAVVREVAREEAPTDWEPLLRTELPGEPLALTDYGLRHDLANFIARTERWDEGRVQGLRRMLAEPLVAGVPGTGPSHQRRQRPGPLHPVCLPHPRHNRPAL